MATNKPNRLLGGLSRVREAGGKVDPDAGPGRGEAPSPAFTHHGKGPAPSRQGKVPIAAYFDPAVRKQLAMLHVEREQSQAALLAEALNLLFERYGKPPIAKA